MKGFILGVVAMVVILALGVSCALLGVVSMRAENPPSNMETALAGRAMDASVARAAPKVSNPVAADETNLVAGARLYTEHCTLCHGDPAHPDSKLADPLHPPAPPVPQDQPDTPD